MHVVPAASARIDSRRAIAPRVQPWRLRSGRTHRRALLAVRVTPAALALVVAGTGRSIRGQRQDLALVAGKATVEAFAAVAPHLAGLAQLSWLEALVFARVAGKPLRAVLGASARCP